MKSNIEKIKINGFDVIHINNDNLWQKPVITEKQIYHNLLKEKIVPYNYIAFPWASYIDNVWTKKYNQLQENIDELISNKKLIDKNKNYFTVIQHIHFRKHIEKLKELNIKYIFTPHKLTSDITIEKKYNISIIPISLFPAQNNTLNEFIETKNKKYIASFVGQICHKNMISNIRQIMYDSFNDKEKCICQVNTKWYYQDNVYGNKQKSYDDKIYKQIMIESKFSLCPSGTGPNSIRLWESLSFGCIPIVLCDNLVLPYLSSINYHECFIFWKESNIHNLYDYLTTINDEVINKMSNNCIKIYNEYFSKKNMHQVIVKYLNNIDNIDMNNTDMNNTDMNNTDMNNTDMNNTDMNNTDSKIILITQYYKVINANKDYEISRQKEIDYCLQKNFDNEYINEIHLLLEEDYNLDFINNKHNIHIVKNINSKRINFKDVFDYYNKNIKNNICILINSDIYLDKSIEVVKNINFNKLFISLNRYENNKNSVPSFLNGVEINNCDYKKCSAFLKPYQESIWSQDAWIWKYPINNVDDNFNFNLGVVGCDNHINYLMQQNGYKILNCSKIICVNHYDRLSIKINKFGISKGNISSEKTEKNRIENISKYLFLENQDDIPDKYTTNIENKFIVKGKANINEVLMKKNISEIDINNSQVIATSFSSEINKPFNVLFKNKSYWESEINDGSPYIQFNFENIYEISVIDIKSKPISKNDMSYGYVSKFKISYLYSDKWIFDKIYEGVEINNVDYIKKIYLTTNIICHKIRIYPIEYVNIRALKIKFYKIDHPK